MKAESSTLIVRGTGGEGGGANVSDMKSLGQFGRFTGYRNAFVAGRYGRLCVRHGFFEIVNARRSLDCMGDRSVAAVDVETANDAVLSVRGLHVRFDKLVAVKGV